MKLEKRTSSNLIENQVVLEQNFPPAGAYPSIDALIIESVKTEFPFKRFIFHFFEKTFPF